MVAREEKGVTAAVEFRQPPRSDFEGAEVKDEVARARVRFLAEFKSRTQGPDGATAQDRRTAEVWTFERRRWRPSRSPRCPVGMRRITPPRSRPSPPAAASPATQRSGRSAIGRARSG